MDKILNEALTIQARKDLMKYSKETDNDKVSWKDFNDLGYNTSNMSEDDFIEGIRIFKKGLTLTKSGSEAPKAEEKPVEEPEVVPEEKVTSEPANEPEVEAPTEDIPNEGVTAEDSSDTTEETSDIEVNDDADSPEEAVSTPTDKEIEAQAEKDANNTKEAIDLGNNVNEGTYKIAKSRWPYVYDTLLRCKKKMGAKFEFKIIGEEVVHQKQLLIENPIIAAMTQSFTRPVWEDPKDIPVYVVQISSEVQNNEWEMAAIVEHVASQKGIVITPLDPKYQIPEKYYYLDNIICDHCEMKRDRTFGAVVYNKATKEYRMVGKSCLKEYTGMDPTDLLSLAHVLSVAVHWDCAIGGSGRHHYYDVNDALFVATAAVKLFGYKKPEVLGYNRWGGADVEEGPTCTKRIIRDIFAYMDDPKGVKLTAQEDSVLDYIKNHVEELKKETEAQKEYIKNIDASGDEFKQVMKVALSGMLIVRKQLGVIACLPAVYGYYVADEEKKKALGAFKPNNEWLPNGIGEVVQINNILKVVKGGKTSTGSNIMNIYTDDGYLLSAYMKDEDLPEDLSKVIRVSGKVYKRYESYKTGEKSTTLSPCKFYTDADLYFADQASEVPLAGNVGDKIIIVPKTVNAGPERAASFTYNSVSYYSVVTITDAMGRKYIWSCPKPEIYENPESLIGKKLSVHIKNIDKDLDGNVKSYHIGGQTKVLEAKDLQISDNLKKIIEAVEDSAFDIDDTIDAAMDDDEDLQECWKAAVEKYKDLWDSKETCMKDEDSISSGLLKIEPHYTDLSYTDDDGMVTACFGKTRHVRNAEHPIVVDISIATFDLSEEEFYNVLLHEMCHVASFLTDYSLDHGPTWAYFKDKLNNCGYNIVTDMDEDDLDVILPESVSKDDKRLRECHFCEMPGHHKDERKEKQFDAAINKVLNDQQNSVSDEEIEAENERLMQDEADFRACLDMYNYDEDGFCDGFTR